jgi:glutaconyl-CoA/methylmalonyl-CoA decarboxylase subunit delta
MIVNEISFDFSNITGLSVMIAIVGYVIVFGALLLLFGIFNSLPKLINLSLRRKMRKSGKAESEEIMLIEGNIAAAISMALYLNLSETHDEESDIITIKRISKQYRPWSSKIYSTNTFFRTAKR